MPNIKSVSDLRNYSDVLRDVTAGSPVFLTKNGRGRYVILDICSGLGAMLSARLEVSDSGYRKRENRG